MLNRHYLADKTNKPLVSIVTVVKNAENCIEKTILSVTKQKYPYIEYIVIDGRSTDSTFSIIKRYSDNITKLICENDSGIYDAMNKALTIAADESQLICFLNAGDTFYTDDTVSHVVTFFNDNNISHFYGTFVVEDKDSEPEHVPAKVSKWSLADEMICHQAIFFRTPSHKRFNYDNKFKICADYKLLLDMIYSGETFKKIDLPIVHYDVTGISSLSIQERRDERNCIRKEYLFVYLAYILKKNVKKMLGRIYS